MKSFIRASAAAGLAAATIVSGISVGSAASASQTVSEARAPSLPSAEIPLSAYDDDGHFAYSLLDGYFGSANSLAEATAKARRFQILPKPDGRFDLLDVVSRRCLTVSAFGPAPYRPYLAARANVCTQTTGEFTVDDEYHLIDADGYYISGTLREGATYFGARKSAENAWHFDALKDLIFSAQVKSVNIADRSAVIEGRGKPGASIVVADGADIIVGEDGSWEADVSALTLGENTLHIEQWETGEKTNETDLAVTLSVHQLTAEASFGATVDDRVTVHGEAEPGADVEVYDEAGTRIGSGMVNNSGEYSIPLDAPDKAGKYSISVSQKVGNDVVDDGVDLDVDYGDGVAITAPADGAEHAAGELVVRGTGQGGANVTVREKGTAQFLDNGTVGVNTNRYTLTVPQVDDREHTFEVIQTSKGNNRTIAEVTVNPGAGDVVEPVSVDAAFDTEDEYAPAKVQLSGEPGAQVSVVNTTTNQQLGTVTLDDSGKATVAVDPSKAQTGVNSFTATQVVDGATTTASDTLDYGQNTGLDVTAPVNGSTVEGPRPTFTGTGQTGAKITVRGTTRTVGSGVVANGQWSFPAAMDLNPNFYALKATQTTKGGLTTTKDVSFTIAAASSVIDLTATAAFDQSDATKPAIVSGKATAGSTVVLKDALGNVIASTTAKSGNVYSMTIPPASAKVGVNDFTVTQRIDGKDIDSKSVSLDYGQPAPIVITSPANGATVAKDGLTFTGTGQDGAKIAVKGMVNTIATGTVSGSTWSAPVAFPLTSNVYQLWAVQTTKGGLRTQQPITITVADTVTTPLTATAQFDPADVNLPAQVVGSAQLDATVIVRDSNGDEIGRKQATGGNYTIPIPAAKAHFGVNTFTVTQVVSGIESAPVTRTLDYGTPAAPTITSPVQNATIENGSLHFTGTGATGAKLTLRGMVNPLGATMIDNGAWTVDIAQNLTPNVYRLFAVQTSKGGLTKQAEVTVTIKDKTVTALTATGAFDQDVTKLAAISGTAQTGGTVVITEGATTVATIPVTGSAYTADIPATVAGVRTFTVTQTVDGVTSAPKTVTLDYGTVAPLDILTPTEGQNVPNGQLTFTGTATPGSQVKVGGTTSTLGTATANNTTGAFTIPVTRTLTPQVYVLYVKQTTKGGLVSDATVRTITITQ